MVIQYSKFICHAAISQIIITVSCATVLPFKGKINYILIRGRHGVDPNAGSMIWMDLTTKLVVGIYDPTGFHGGGKYAGSMIPQDPATNRTRNYDLCGSHGNLQHVDQ